MKNLLLIMLILSVPCYAVTKSAQQPARSAILKAVDTATTSVAAKLSSTTLSYSDIDILNNAIDQLKNFTGLKARTALSTPSFISDKAKAFLGTTQQSPVLDFFQTVVSNAFQIELAQSGSQPYLWSAEALLFFDRLNCLLNTYYAQ